MSAEPEKKQVLAAAEGKKKISRPDQKEFQAKLADLEVKLREKEHALEKARNNVKNAKGPNGKNEAREKLLKRMQELRARHNELKIARGKVQDQVKSIESAIGKKINDLQAVRGKNNFKSIEEIDKRIKQLEGLIETGNLRLVEEKRNISEISNLNKLRKSFSGLELAQKAIDTDRERVTELRKSLNDAEYKQIGSDIGIVLKELDSLKESDQAAFKSRSNLLDARTAATKARDDVRDSIRKLKDDYYGAKKAFNEQIKLEQQVRIEREKAERKAQEKSKKLEDAKAKLEAAKQPAFATHIEMAQNLLLYFDPGYKKESAPTSLLVSSTTKNKVRETAAIEEGPGEVESEKNENNAELESSKNTRKTKKSKDGKLKLNLSLIEDLSHLNIPIPTSKDDVSNTILKIKEKIEFYRTNEARITAEKVERAEAEYEKLITALESADLEDKDNNKGEEEKTD